MTVRLNVREHNDVEGWVVVELFDEDNVSSDGEPNIAKVVNQIISLHDALLRTERVKVAMLIEHINGGPSCHEMTGE